MEIKLQDHVLIIAVLFIILIYMAMTGKNKSKEYKTILVLTGALFISYMLDLPGKISKLLNNNSTVETEHMEEPRKITNSVISEDGNIIIDTDENALSQFGNIGTSNDIDTLIQRNTDLDMTDVNEDDLDNSDLVQEVMQRGSSIFQPNTAQGVTSSQSAEHSNFTLAQPGMYMEYSVPINPRGYTADEALARKQQHRSDINKKAIDGAVRTTRNVFDKFFQNELNENEQREWWSAEAAEFETDFRPYY